ncbi:sugar transporter [Ruegeria sp. 2205SS24-7]|uniref:sugar transporter n=1 Tax=Ruegeria discodermiae TaxID=3064389 RepID=UPI002741DD8D|nr:sugar transporter [Ruegeria sp. 2205SS24-7]MDP5220750.1 sugar transporter [Ruegeria sp. 2205SS24-7]
MTQDADASKAGVKTVDGAEKKAGASGPKKPRKQPAAQGGKPARQSKLTAVPNPGRVAARRRRKRRRQSVLKKPVPQPQVTVRPLAQPAAMKQRHWGLMLSFVLIVLLPLVGLTYYLWTQAEDQYSSTTAFTVRSEEGGSASDLLGGFAQFAAGSSTGVDSDILYEFIQSQEIVEAIDARLDLRAHYATYWPRDWMFSIWPDATLEDLVWFWQRIVRISYDQSTGLIELRVLAFDPDFAQRVAEEIVRESQDMINALSDQAREDAMRYAREDLDETIIQLKAAREALTEFRTRTRIVDPGADIQGRMGVMHNLQQALAEALIAHDLLRGTTLENDPRLTNAQRRIDVIRERIAAERQTFASDSTELGAVGEDYPSLIAEYESLSVDRQFAEETYRVALTALDVARDNAARQSRYLATYIKPTFAQSSEFPRRFILLGLAVVFLVMLWSILALIYYSIRDRG